MDGRIILKLNSEKQGKKVWAGFMWLRIGTTAGRSENDNVPSGSI
jgi:hypothetical protein